MFILGCNVYELDNEFNIEFDFEEHQSTRFLNRIKEKPNAKSSLLVERLHFACWKCRAIQLCCMYNHIALTFIYHLPENFLNKQMKTLSWFKHWLWGGQTRKNWGGKYIPGFLGKWDFFSNSGIFSPGIFYPRFLVCPKEEQKSSPLHFHRLHVSYSTHWCSLHYAGS